MKVIVRLLIFWLIMIILPLRIAAQDPIIDFIVGIEHPSVGRVKPPQFLPYGHVNKNKPRTDLQWQVYETKHFKLAIPDDNQEGLVDYCLEVLERKYDKNSPGFKIDGFNEKIFAIAYLSRTDFEKTNMAPVSFWDGLEGFTEGNESKKKRLVIYFRGSKNHFENLAGHELTHSFQNEKELERKWTDLSEPNLPRWVTEGMAEYNSRPWNPESDLVVRDLFVHDRVPSLASGIFWAYFHQYPYGHLAINYIQENCKSDLISNPIKEIIFRGETQPFAKILPDICNFTLEELDQRLRGELVKRYGQLAAKLDLATKSQRIGDGLLLGASNHFFLTINGRFGREVLTLQFRDGSRIISKIIAEGGRVGREKFGIRSDLLLGVKAAFHGEEILYVERKASRDRLTRRSFSFDAKKKKIGLGKPTQYGWKTIREIHDPVFLTSTTIAFIGKSRSFDQIYLFDIERDTLTQITSGTNDYQGLTYSRAHNLLVTAVENGDGKDNYNYDLLAIDLNSRTGYLLWKTPANEFAPEFSPDGQSLLFVGDQGFTYNLYRWDWQTKLATYLTDAQIGFFSPKWLSKDLLAFNGLSDMSLQIYAAPMPELTVSTQTILSTKTDGDELEALKRIDHFFEKKVPGHKNLTILKRMISSDRKTGLVVVNRNLSLEETTDYDSPIHFYVLDLFADTVSTFSIKKFKRVSQLAGIQLLPGSKILVGHSAKHSIDDEIPQLNWYLYDWQTQKLEPVQRFGRLSRDNSDWLGGTVDVSTDSRYLALDQEHWVITDKVVIYDVLTGGFVKESKLKPLLGIQFVSSNTLVTVENIGPEGDSKENLKFSLLSLPTSTVISSQTIKESDLLGLPGREKKKVVNWQASSDGERIAIALEAPAIGKNISYYEIWMIDLKNKQLWQAAKDLSRVDQLAFKNQLLSVTGRDLFQRPKKILVDANQTVRVESQESLAISTETVKTQSSPFPLDKNRFLSSARVPRRTGELSTIVQPIRGQAIIGFGFGSQSGFSGGAAGAVYGYDDLSDRQFGIEAWLQGTTGLAQFGYTDLERRETYTFGYWHLSEAGQAAALSWKKDLSLDRYRSWDFTVSQEYINFKDYYAYPYLNEKSMKTRIGSTFGLNTSVSEWHGPHSGNKFFSGVEAAMDSKGRFGSFDTYLEASHYTPITERFGIALRAAAGKSFGPEPTIFPLGGNKTIRGVSLFKIHGNNYAFGNAEFRFPALDFAGVKFSGPIDGFLGPLARFFNVQSGIYGDIGDAWYNRDQSLFSGGRYRPQWKYSAGSFLNIPSPFGIDVRFSKGFFGEKGWTFWLGYNW